MHGDDQWCGNSTDPMTRQVSVVMSHVFIKTTKTTHECCTSREIHPQNWHLVMQLNTQMCLDSGLSNRCNLAHLNRHEFTTAFSEPKPRSRLCKLRRLFKTKTQPATCNNHHRHHHQHRQKWTCVTNLCFFQSSR